MACHFSRLYVVISHVLMMICNQLFLTKFVVISQVQRIIHGNEPHLEDCMLQISHVLSYVG